MKLMIQETKERMHLSFKDVVNEVIDWLKIKHLIYPLTAIGFRLVMGELARSKPEIIT